ncbi:hypothetical protein EB564_0013245 [Escherichia coli]|nr:hypothetical protein [Escherichia coli]
MPTISAQHFHTAVHNEEQLAALEEASWTSRLPSG